MSLCKKLEIDGAIQFVVQFFRIKIYQLKWMLHLKRIEMDAILPKKIETYAKEGEKTLSSSP
jgi:hypothetical protein